MKIMEKVENKRRKIIEKNVPTIKIYYKYMWFSFQIFIKKNPKNNNQNLQIKIQSFIISINGQERNIKLLQEI